MVFAMPAKKGSHRGKRTLGPNSIRAWRKSKNLTLEQLAEMIDSAAGVISRIERGKRPWSQPFLEDVAAALGCEPADLISRRPRSQEEVEIQTALEKMTPDERSQALRVLKSLRAA